jgi:hypothetical protein
VGADGQRKSKEIGRTLLEKALLRIMSLFSRPSVDDGMCLADVLGGKLLHVLIDLVKLSGEVLAKLEALRPELTKLNA